MWLLSVHIALISLFLFFVSKKNELFLRRGSCLNLASPYGLIILQLLGYDFI